MRAQFAAVSSCVRIRWLRITVKGSMAAGINPPVAADGNVQIISKNEKVYGDRGEYKIDDQNFVLVGGNLRINQSG